MNIKKGVTSKPLKTVIYGPEGIGKSTFASKFPTPVFIDTEGSTDRLDVNRFEDINTMDDVMKAITALRTEQHEFKTLVVDTMDKLEIMLSEAVCKAKNVSGIEDIGYGKGYTYRQEEANKFLGALDALRMAKNMNIVIVCHAFMRKFEQPDEMGAYDRWELKLSKKVAPLVKEWADMVLFANYKTLVVTDEKTKSKKAQGGKRVLYTSHHACWDAKNRVGLPEQMDMDFKEIAHLFKTDDTVPFFETEPVKGPTAEVKELTPLEKLEALMAEAGITEDEVILTFHEKGKFPDATTLDDVPDDFIAQNVLAQWNSFKRAVEKIGQNNPFIKHKNKEE